MANSTTDSARPETSPGGATTTDPASSVEVVIEIAKGSRNKYEIDHISGRPWLDRHLFTSMAYPADYGFIEHTLSEDGDPLDALVFLDEPTFSGCHIWGRPLGMFQMTDEAGPDAKILLVPDGDPRWDHLQDLHDVPAHRLAEITHFFQAYKDLEPDKMTSIGSWLGRSAAEAEIIASRERATQAARHRCDSVSPEATSPVDPR